MQTKTYRGLDLDSVLERAGRELGPGARVLERRAVADREGNTVEIRVAHDGAEAATSSPHGPSHLEDGTGAPILAGACRRLLDAGLSRNLAERFAAIAARELPVRHDLAGFTRATECGIEALVPFEPFAHRAEVLFLCGPPGAGKTTTTAKLAARQPGPTIWVDADGERIGAREQAEILSRHAGARLVRASDSDTLRRIVRDAPQGARVFVDTCGVGAADDARLERLGHLREAVPRARVALLLPAGIHHAAARATIERFRRIRPSCIAFSKVDDAGHLGELLTGLAGSDLPLSFITTGHTIPDDLDEATPARLARLLLGLPRVAGREIFA